MENENEDGASQNAEQQTIEQLEQAPEGETPEQKVERLENLNKQLFNRAKKAEGFEEVDGKWVKKPKPVAPAPTAPTQQNDALTGEDTIALMHASVHPDDIAEVKKFAKGTGLTVPQALKDKTLLTILGERNEERKTAEATSTRSPRTSSSVSGTDLLDKARAGETIPESNIDKLAEARMAAKRGK